MILLTTVALASPATKTTALAEDFVARIAAADDSAAELCTDAFRTRSRLNCNRLVTELVRMTPSIEVGDAVTVKKGGVVRLDLRVPEEGRVSIWLRAEKAKGGWRFMDGTDPDEGPTRLGGVAFTPPPPSGLADAFRDAVANGTVTELCSEAFAAMGDDGCNEVAEEASRKRFTLQVVDEVERGDRRVVIYDVVAEGEVKDRIWAYFIAGKVDGIDETPEHVEPFLSGKVAGTIAVDGLPDPPELRAFAEALLAGTTGQTFAEGEILQLEQPKLGRTWWHDALGSGMICYLSDNESPLKFEVTKNAHGFEVGDKSYGYQTCNAYADEFF